MSNNRQNALKDYVEVNVRVEQFYTKFPMGRIVTELISWNDGVVVMKAEAYRHIDDTVPSSTGHAYEKEGSSFINKTSALENCETSAVGRALALLGFEIKKSIASKEEVENAKLNQNKEPQTTKETLLAKWKLLGGTDENFGEWYEGQAKKYNNTQIDVFLTKKIQAKK